MRRLLDSVVLDKGVKERVVEDVQNFMKRGQWYFERGELRLFLPFDFSGRSSGSDAFQGFRIDEAIYFTVHQDPENRHSFKPLPAPSNTTFVSSTSPNEA